MSDDFRHRYNPIQRCGRRCRGTCTACTRRRKRYALHLVNYVHDEIEVHVPTPSGETKKAVLRIVTKDDDDA